MRNDIIIIESLPGIQLYFELWQNEKLNDVWGKKRHLL